MQNKMTVWNPCVIILSAHVPFYHFVWQIHRLRIAVIDQVGLLRGGAGAVRAERVRVGISFWTFDDLEC